MYRAWCKVPYAVINDPMLMPTAKLVYAAIAYRVGSNGCCWPGMRRLASDTRLHVNSIVRAVEELETAGWLMVERRGKGQSNLYRLREPDIKTVLKMQTPEQKRHQGSDRGVRRMSTDAPPESAHNKIKIDKLNTSAAAAQCKAAADETIEIDQSSKEFLDWFSQTYRQRNGCDYMALTAKEAKLLKDLLDKIGSEQLKQAATNMFNHPVWGKR